MMRKFLKQVNKFLLISSALLMAIDESYANSLTLSVSLQNENFQADDGKDVTRMALGAVGVEYEMNLFKKISVGILGGAQTSLISQENLSFGLGGFLNFYFKGNPVKSEFQISNAYISGMERTAYFYGFGIEERFLNSTELDSEIRGGPFIRFGGHYFWSSKMFVTGSLKYLVGGEQYSSIDLILGMGFFL